MSAFIGYEDVGVWTSNAGRDTFLDWFAEHRCARGDTGREFCTSEANRWPGCCIELSELIPHGRHFEVTEAERAAATRKHGPELVELLDVVSQIVRGVWKHLSGSQEAIYWRKCDKEQQARWQREQDELLLGPLRSTSFGPDDHVTFLPIDDEKSSDE